jgi:uncharacterized membrane protein YbhN (UPF0104 family)
VTFTKVLRQFLPIIVSVAIVTLAGKVLVGTLRHIRYDEVVATLHAIPIFELCIGLVFVAGLYSALATCEMAIARYVAGPVSERRALLGALLAAPIGHAIGWGAVSGAAIRYRIYAAAGMRPLEIGKFALLASIPYPAGLGLLLGVSLVIQSGAAGHILHVEPAVARGAGLALLALHAAYLTLIATRRGPLPLGRMLITLPPPPLTTVQYCVGIVEVCCGAAVLYVLLPDSVGLPFTVFVGVYVLCILAGLASSVPAGIGVFESVLLLLLPRVPPAELLGSVVAYRSLLELIPLLLSLTLFAAYELWWRLPPQRARVAAIRAAQARSDD